MGTNHRSPENASYFAREMKEEFFVNYARREARKLIKHLEHYKISSDLEAHLKLKYKFPDGS